MKRFVLCLLLAAVGVALAGCGGSGSHSRTSHSRTTADSPLVVAIGRKASAGVSFGDGAKLISPTRLAIVTAGSSSCPAVPNKLVVQNPHTIRIHLTRGTFRRVGHSHRMRLVSHAHDANCTTDLTTTPMIVAIDPQKVDVHRPVTVRFYYYSSTEPVTRTAPGL